MRPPAAFVLLVKDHVDHSVGFSDSALDITARVSWAWECVQRASYVEKGAIKPLQLDVRARTVDNSKKGRYAELLRQAIASVDQLLPLLAKAWDPAAPDTLRENIAEKLGKYDIMQHMRAVSEDAVDVTTVAEACSLPMRNLTGAKRAAFAMLVAAIFAAELSNHEAVPVLVLGRPPGHHATCAHCLDVRAPPHPSPGGPLDGRSMGGGCFYPSCWLAAVHSLRKGFSHRLAYIDVDAHKPDGIWKEVERLRTLDKPRRSELLDGKDSRCEGVFFASVHVDGYPNPGGSTWTSADCALPKGAGNAFKVNVHEQLLQGVGEDGTTPNTTVLEEYEAWKDKTLQGLQNFQPDGVFVGLGFDLHVLEARINDKREGVGLSRQHYHDMLSCLASTCPCGPVVLTLEGGYTKAAVRHGMRGTLAGLVAFSQKRKSQHHKQTRQMSAKRRMSVMKKPSTKTKALPGSAKKLRRSLASAMCRRAL